jgi:hypothetical protein
MENHLSRCDRASALVRRSVRRSHARNLERLPHGARAVSTRDSLALCAGNLREGAGRSLEARIAAGPEYPAFDGSIEWLQGGHAEPRGLTSSRHEDG